MIYGKNGKFITIKKRVAAQATNGKRLTNIREKNALICLILKL